jgi:hypothetical protein
MVPGRIGFGQVEVGGPDVEEIRVGELGVKNELFQVRDNRGVDEQMRW